MCEGGGWGGGVVAESQMLINNNIIINWVFVIPPFLLFCVNKSYCCSAIVFSI